MVVTVSDSWYERTEQICPFPYDLVGDVVKRYKNAEIYFAQEEPFNKGPWSYVEPRIVTAVKDFCDKRPFFVGRNAAASPATGR